MASTFQAKSVVFLVTATAALGLLMGALFGVAAGVLAPTFFGRLVPWENIEPVGIAIVMGAFGGVMSASPALSSVEVGRQNVVRAIACLRSLNQGWMRTNGGSFSS